MRRRVLGVALAAVVLVAGYWFLPRAGPQAVQEERSESPRVSTSGRVTALGRLAPRDEVISVSAPDGDRLLRLEVREGQAVETGAILAYLESHAERRAEAQRIEHQLAESVARLDAETTYGQAVIVESEARIRQVETVSALEIQAQEARVQQLMGGVGAGRRRPGAGRGPLESGPHRPAGARSAVAGRPPARDGAARRPGPSREAPAGA